MNGMRKNRNFRQILRHCGKWRQCVIEWARLLIVFRRGTRYNDKWEAAKIQDDRSKSEKGGFFMKNSRRAAAAFMSAAVLLCSMTAGTGMPKQSAAPLTALTASAAEADYPWSDYLKKSADWFGSQEARTVADACIQYQVANEGGWQKGMGTEHTGDWAHSTIDNDATTSQIRFLMRTYQQTKQQKYFDCAMRGVDCLFKMQYSNGGWMQCLNTPNTYHAHITLNDGAYLHVLSIMKEMSKKSGDFTAVSDAYAQKAAASLEKGIQCLLDMQIVNNGVRTAWCQQHDENTLKPTSARAYELPSTCSSESAGVVQFLYQEAKETGRSDLAESVNAAIKWFQKVQLNGIKFEKQGDDKVVVQDANASPLWARFYELGTERPLFSDRDSSVHYNVAEISKERRTGYAWYGNWGKNVVNLALLEAGQQTTTPQTTTPPETEPEYTGALIAKLIVHDTKNGANWSIQQNLQNGSAIFGDRAYTAADLPESLAGAEYIRTACDSKSYGSALAELTAAEDIRLYIMLDQRVNNYVAQQGISPNWLDDYTHMRTQVFSSNGEEFTVYVRDLKAGETVTLGSNFTNQNAVCYFAAAVKKLPETTETVTTTTESTTTEDTTSGTRDTTTTTTTTITTTRTENTTIKKRKVSGDTDCSWNVDVSDAVLLARYLAEDKTARISDDGLKNADCDGEAGVTGGDLTQILLYIARQITEFPS